MSRGFACGDGGDGKGDEDGWEACLGDRFRRLAALAGRGCPRCRRALWFDGRRLYCLCSEGGCGYSWSNPQGAEDEIRAK